MIDRIISGPLRTGLRGFVLESANAFAQAHGMTLVIVTLPGLFSEWKRDLKTVECVSQVQFMRGTPSPSKRLYVVEVPRNVEDHIGAALSDCGDFVWIMRYSC